MCERLEKSPSRARSLKSYLEDPVKLQRRARARLPRESSVTGSYLSGAVGLRRLQCEGFLVLKFYPWDTELRKHCGPEAWVGPAVPHILAQGH